MLKEFKAFAMRGNVLELAVGFIMGTAFGAVVNSLVEDVIMNLVAALAGKPDFSDLTFALGRGVIRYGSLMTAVVNFLLVAMALFAIVKVTGRLLRPRGASDVPPTIRECPFCLSGIPVKASRCSACTSEVEPLAA